MPVDHANHLPQFLHKEVKDAGGRAQFSGERHDWGLKNVQMQFKDWGGRAQIQQMPGCCAIMTISYVGVNPDTPETFTKTIGLITAAAKKAAFGSIVLTQVCHGRDERELWYPLLKEGFIKSPEFVNAKSGNRVAYLTKDLGQTGQMEGFEEWFEEA